MTEPGPWKIFFDTTEFSSWRVLSPELSHRAARIGAQGFVSALVLEEVACQHLRDLKSEHDRAKAVAEKIPPYVTVKPRESDAVLLDRLREEVRAKTPKWITEIPVADVSVDDLLMMSTRRFLPFRQAGKHLVGFHDAVILVSYIKFARAQGLNPCVFVSTNIGDFTAESVKGLGSKYATTWLLLNGCEELSDFLRDPDLAQTVTEAFNEHLGLIEEYVGANLWLDMRTMMVQLGGLVETPTRASFRAESVSARLDSPLQASGDGKVRFHAVVPVEVEGSLRPITLATGITRETTGVFKFHFTIEGEATLPLKNRQVVGPPKITRMTLTSMTDVG